MTYLLSHNSVRRDVLHLFHAPAVALPELVQILEVLVAQIVLDLRVQVEVRERVRERGVVRHALRARGRGPAGRRRRGRRRDGDEAIDGGRDARARVRGRLGLEVHRRRALLSAARSAELVCRSLTNGHGVGFRWRRGSDIKLERLEIALCANRAAHDTVCTKFGY